MLKEIIILGSLVVGSVYCYVDTQIMPYTEEWRQECADRVYEGWDVCKTITPERYNEIIERTAQAVEQKEQEQNDREFIRKITKQQILAGDYEVLNNISSYSDATYYLGQPNEKEEPGGRAGYSYTWNLKDNDKFHVHISQNGKVNCYIN